MAKSKIRVGEEIIIVPTTKKGLKKERKRIAETCAEATQKCAECACKVTRVKYNSLTEYNATQVSFVAIILDEEIKEE